MFVATEKVHPTPDLEMNVGVEKPPLEAANAASGTSAGAAPAGTSAATAAGAGGSATAAGGLTASLAAGVASWTLVLGVVAAVGTVASLVVVLSSENATTNPTATASSGGIVLNTGISLDQVAVHDFKHSCWVAIHGKVLDVTEWRKSHPGGNDKIECGKDLTTEFTNQHGDLQELERRIETVAKEKVIVKGNVATVSGGAAGASPSSTAAKKVQFDFSNVVKKPHPGSGSEWKTLVYIEQKGGVDGAAMFLNTADSAEQHVWCEKRPTLAAESACECIEGTPHPPAKHADCTKWKVAANAVHPLAGTGGMLAMTDLIGGSETGWIKLWNEHKMAVVPGIGRFDHGRSHFEVKDAAAKGVSVEKEKTTTHGWLAKAIFAYNNLYVHPFGSAKQLEPNAPDAISLANAAAGPNALEVSDDSISYKTYQHISGVRSADSVVRTSKFDFVNPFATSSGMMMGGMMAGRNLRGEGELRESTSSTGETERTEGNDRKLADHSQEQDECSGGKCAFSSLNNEFSVIDFRHLTDEEEWARTKTNLGLQELLAKEASIFEGIGLMQSKLNEYKDNLNKHCPYGSFPEVAEWAAAESDANIGMQLRAVAILMVNGIRPKVFQLQQTKYDTHSNQGPRLQILLSDLRTGIYTFILAAERCGFFDDTLVTTFTEFGRRLEENSRKGTDHGWSNYFTVFGKGLQRRVFGYDPVTQSADLHVIVPKQTDAYLETKGTKGDLPLITSIQTWNACILNALALPALPRLGRCPLRLRANLNQIDYFVEAEYYANPESADDSASSIDASATLTGDGDTSHLGKLLTTTELLHFSRRVGFAPQTEAFDVDISTARKLAVQNPTMLRNADGSTNTTVTLQNAISRVLAVGNTAMPTTTPPVFYKWNIRKHNGLALWSKERRERRNNYEDLLQLPFPRYDTIEKRLQRWDLEQFFDMSSLTVNPQNEQDGSINVKPALTSANTEHLILEKLQEKATVFYIGQPIKKSTGKIGKRNYDAATGKVVKPEEVDWYKTVMQTPDVKAITEITAEKIVNDWKCDKATSKHPDDATVPCNPDCDLRDYIDVFHHNETALLKREFVDLQKGADNTKQSAPWFRLKECVKTDSARKTFENERSNQMKAMVKDKLFDRYFADFTDKTKALRSRMVWFFLNYYATPSTAVNDMLLMYQQYEILYKHALGNYRTLAFHMFNDKALRKSLDQLEETECDKAPIENFSREWFERFTVGIQGHNEGDVKRLSKGLLNCRDNTETSNADLMAPGVIFENVDEVPWTLTVAEQRAVVDKILDKRMGANEPPAAAQFLCWKLYKEFGREPPMTGTMSAIGMPPPVVSCARHFYDHNYDLTFALEHILQDKANFLDTLGTKPRWPHGVIFGAWTEFQPLAGMDRSHAAWRLTQVGMQPFEPQDVSGYDLHSVWTLDRISAAHQFLEQKVKTKLESQAEKWHFANQTVFEQLYADYEYIPAAGSAEGSSAGSGLYSVAVRLCSNQFVDVKGLVGAHLVDVKVLFGGGTEANSQTKRWRKWKDALAIAVSNVCQFVC
eukprot:CAMPEP_0179009312 /NCGR_PEP_ID=MMETSP0795-20121207/16205_1 /TAXON_ID=88552 /ORGANISM="Amoebophrya sp., Strain Ameob2" /LENGTH=1536 /DNA_ID=CAMNT_0020704501 /DNA_START=63 /DNA_END=4673 /DNA_ORIENTATION=-